MQNSGSRDTITALSSGQLPAGVAVIRISGPAVRQVVTAITGSLPPPRSARYDTFRLSDASVLDKGLTLFFAAPRSFTGEDCAEFHLHGGRAVVDALLREICTVDGCRLATAGEFSRRAFQNGKMDLLTAEATADLVSAETEAQRRFAAQNGDGRHAALYAEWRSRLIRARALIEAELDFSDEADIPGSVSEEVWADVSVLRENVGAHIASFGKAEMLRNGFDVVLVGAPNAGKSSLLNALVQREAAIVTPEPGTTRDLIEVVLDIDGLKVRLTDTAGLREAEGLVERLGIERAEGRAKAAGLVLLLEDLAEPITVGLETTGTEILTVGTKLDLCRLIDPSRYDFVVSCVSGEGLQRLLDGIAERARAAAPSMGELVPWRLRHVELLQTCERHLEAGLQAGDWGLELRSEDLRLAANALGRISGAVDVEDLLDVIFGQFCIGK